MATKTSLAFSRPNGFRSTRMRCLLGMVIVIRSISGHALEGRRAHRVERLLHGETLMLGESFEQGAANSRMRLVPVDTCIRVNPSSREHRGHDPIGGVLKRRVPVAEETAEGRSGRLEQEQIVDARHHAQSAARAVDSARTRLAGLAGRMRADARGRPRRCARVAVRRSGRSPFRREDDCSRKWPASTAPKSSIDSSGCSLASA